LNIASRNKSNVILLSECDPLMNSLACGTMRRQSERAVSGFAAPDWKNFLNCAKLRIDARRTRVRLAASGGFLALR